MQTQQSTFPSISVIQPNISVQNVVPSQHTINSNIYYTNLNHQIRTTHSINNIPSTMHMVRIQIPISQQLGEILYPKVFAKCGVIYSHLAPKITGMMLDKGYETVCKYINNHLFFDQHFQMVLNLLVNHLKSNQNLSQNQNQTQLQSHHKQLANEINDKQNLNNHTKKNQKQRPLIFDSPQTQSQQLHRKKLLIFGYIRCIKTTQIVPNDIINLCILFCKVSFYRTQIFVFNMHSQIGSNIDCIIDIKNQEKLSTPKFVKLNRDSSENCIRFGRTSIIHHESDMILPSHILNELTSKYRVKPTDEFDVIFEYRYPVIGKEMSALIWNKTQTNNVFDWSLPSMRSLNVNDRKYSDICGTYSDIYGLIVISNQRVFSLNLNQFENQIKWTEINYTLNMASNSGRKCCLINEGHKLYSVYNAQGIYSGRFYSHIYDLKCNQWSHNLKNSCFFQAKRKLNIESICYEKNKERVYMTGNGSDVFYEDLKQRKWKYLPKTIFEHTSRTKLWFDYDSCVLCIVSNSGMESIDMRQWNARWQMQNNNDLFDDFYGRQFV